MPKRILFARDCDAKNYNAQAKNVQGILSYWRSCEYRPSVFAFEEPNQDVAANPNVDIIHLPSNHLWPCRLFGTYMGSFEAVFCPGLHHLADWLALNVRAHTGCRLPSVTTLEGLLGDIHDDERERQFSAVAKHRVYAQRIPTRLCRRAESLCEAADHIIAISPFLARQGIARYGNKVSWLPLGTDLSLFRPREVAQRPRPRVVGAGTVCEGKRADVFIDLATALPQADFVWFGEGAKRECLVAESKRLGLKNLAFPGGLQASALALEFASSDIFLLPSLAEGVPKVTQEAAACGLPQVIFGYYEAPTVIDGYNGFVVWSDAEMLARVRQLLDSAHLANAWAAPESRWPRSGHGTTLHRSGNNGLLMR